MRRNFAAFRVFSGSLRKIADSQSDSQGRESVEAKCAQICDQSGQMFLASAWMFHGKIVSPLSRITSCHFNQRPHQIAPAVINLCCHSDAHNTRRRSGPRRLQFEESGRSAHIAGQSRSRAAGDWLPASHQACCLTSV